MIIRPTNQPLNNNSVKSLLHLNGANNSTTITDSAKGGGYTWSVGGAAKISTAISKLGASSLYLGGFISGAYDSSMNLGSKDFTFAAWALRAAANVFMSLVCRCTASITVYPVLLAISHENKVYLDAMDSTGASHATSSTSTHTDTTSFHHMALVRHGDYIKSFYDGKLVVQMDYTGLTNIASTEPLILGKLGSNNLYPWTGYVNEFLFVPGHALWTRDFTPPNRQM